MALKQRQRAATESLTLLAVVAGILVLGNVLSSFWYARLDLTRTGAFSLSEGSKRVVRDLDDKMTVTLYFTPDLPPPHNATERYVRDLLAEYEAASAGNLAVRIVHPDTEEERERAAQDGVQRQRIQAIVNDTPSFVDAYQGVVLEYLGDKKVIAPVQGTEGLEYTLTQAMKELTGVVRSIGIVSGHGSPTPEEGLTRLQDLLPTHQLQSVSAASPIDDSLAALLVVTPVEALSDAELMNVDQYLMRGGSVGFFGGTMQINAESFEALAAAATDSRVNRVLEKWGIRMRSDIVADAQCSRMPLTSPVGMQVMVPYPPIPAVVFSDQQREHPILFRLDNAVVPFTSSLEILDAGDDDVQLIPLATTTDQSWRIEGSSIALRPRPPQEWRPSAETGPFTLVAAIEGRLPSAFAEQTMMSASDGAGAPPEPDIDRAEHPVRVLVAGTGMLLRDEILPTREQLQQRPMTGGLALVLNAMDWLSQDSDLIAIRAKTVEDPALEVPNAVLAAREDALQAEEAARAAAQQGEEAAAEDAVTEQQAAIKRHAAAMEAWQRKKDRYRWGHMLGLPLLLALFGVIRWRMRLSKKRTLQV
jgi:ABC-2 type transport system permease protein